MPFSKHPPLIRAVPSTAVASGLMTHQYAPFPLPGRYGLSSPFTNDTFSQTLYQTLRHILRFGEMFDNNITSQHRPETDL